MARYSANLGFLWSELQPVEAVAAAASAGFDAVEFHWPYDTPAAELRGAVEAAGIPALSVNTDKGGEGMFGLCAVPGEEARALEAFDAALAYAAGIGAGFIHAMAGIAPEGAGGDVFAAFLKAAAPKAASAGACILVEPINLIDVPGYALNSPEQAEQLIGAVGGPSVRMMYDCYHAGMSARDIKTDLERFLPIIGHVQIAAVPGRGEPDGGELDYPAVMALLDSLGYDGFVGAEYRPGGPTENGLGWLENFRLGG